MKRIVFNGGVISKSKPIPRMLNKEMLARWRRLIFIFVFGWILGCGGWDEVVEVKLPKITPVPTYTLSIDDYPITDCWLEPGEDGGIIFTVVFGYVKDFSVEVAEVEGVIFPPELFNLEIYCKRTGDE